MYVMYICLVHNAHKSYYYHYYQRSLGEVHLPPVRVAANFIDLTGREGTTPKVEASKCTLLALQLVHCCFDRIKSSQYGVALVQAYSICDLKTRGG